MSEMVKCNICGKTFNDRYVNSHKRLAHQAKSKRARTRLSEPEMIQEILFLYKHLSEEKKQELHARLQTVSSEELTSGASR